MNYAQKSQLKPEVFQRVTGVKIGTFTKMTEILNEADIEKSILIQRMRLDIKILISLFFCLSCLCLQLAILIIVLFLAKYFECTYGKGHLF